ncbi:MAG: lipopolysaccharide kinase InaA family protein [Gammaproteobacteria bacterium]|nr:lipopolysaccharide kinase InaA family protein [Gammaproteobacteria bacterium]
MASDRLPPGWQLVQSSSHARVAHNPQLQLYYKEFLPRSPAESLKALLRGSRATRARNNSDALLRAGIDAPANIAWGKLGGGREYLFSATVPGDGISQWLRDTLSQRRGQALVMRRRLLSELGTFIGRLHATGFIHGDLRPGNVLVSLQGEHFHFALIDNERTMRVTPPTGRQLLRNLMQLNMLMPSDLSTTDRMRFFRAWHRQMRDLSRLEAAILATEAYRWAMRRLDEKGLL